MIEDPHAGCREVRFRAPLTLEPAGELALEDYARVLLRGRLVVLIPAAAQPPGYDSGPTLGVHVCDPDAPADAQAEADIEAFAQTLAVAPGASGLGWS